MNLRLYAIVTIAFWAGIVIFIASLLYLPALLNPVKAPVEQIDPHPLSLYSKIKHPL